MCIFLSFQSFKKKDNTFRSKDIQIDGGRGGIVHNHQHTMKVTPANQTLQRRRKSMSILQRKRLWLIYNTDARLTNISDALKRNCDNIIQDQPYFSIEHLVSTCDRPRKLVRFPRIKHDTV
jgi:hypothetical protein